MLIENLPTPNVDGVPTPTEWPPRGDAPSKPFGAEEVSMFAVGGELGYPVGYEQEHGGERFAQFYPTRKSAYEQSSKSSSVVLECHQEHYYLPAALKQDYLMILCLRPGEVGHRAATTHVDIRTMPELATAPAPLFQPHYQSAMNTLHAECLGAREPLKSHVLAEKRPILQKHPDGGAWIDMFDAGDGHFPDSEEAAAAVAWLTERVRSAMQRTVLKRGDLLVIDNWHVVHGRDDFKALFNGSDRWMMRTNVVITSKFASCCEGKLDVSAHVCSRERCVCDHIEKGPRDFPVPAHTI